MELVDREFRKYYFGAYLAILETIPRFTAALCAAICIITVRR